MASISPDRDPQQNSWEEEGFGDADNAQQTSQHSEHQEPDFSLDQAPDVSGDSTLDLNDGGEYDPESVSAPSSKPEAAKAPAKRVRVAGGFLVGDSDEEDEVPTPTSKDGASKMAAARSSPDSAQPGPSVPDVPPTASYVKNGGLSPAAAGPDGPLPTSVPSTARPAQQHDVAATLEEQVKEDPRGAMDSWLALMDEYRRRNRINDARSAYSRFLAIFPQAAHIWVAYLEMELELNNFVEAEQLFSKSLLSVPNVKLWTVYLDYIRRRNDLSSDTTGQARQTITQAYEFVIDNIGVDKDSGRIWSDYVQFVRSAPGQIGGSNWQDQQKMDQLRKIYQRAICMPIPNVTTLWKEYDQFEMGLNKMTGRKFLQEKSPSYMTARSAHTALENITRGLVRTTLPRLPPAPGFEGYEEYMEQVKLWKKWIAWEKDDPLVLKQDEPEAYRQRVLYCYKQALMALRFWPEMWVDAARWCFENGISKDGKDVGLEFLVEGIKANPESVLLALSHGDRIESTFPMEEGDEAKVLRGNAVRAPYNKVLDTLYDMTKSLKDREKAEIARIEASAPVRASPVAPENDDEDAENSDKAEEKAKQDKIKLVQQGFAVQTQLLSRTISFVWIALIRAMRRIQGKGKPNNPLGGARHVFSEARQRGRLTSDVYVAVAQLEWNVYRDPVGTKIFERGAKLFPEDEFFMLEYLKHLHSIHDTTNARVVFETCVNRLVQKPENVHKAKVLYKYFHRYESHYGELSQIKKLEDRMAELFPDDPKLATFSARFSSDSFDPIAARLIVSPAVQMRPKLLVQSIEQAPSASESPRPQLRQEQSPRTQFLRATSSPKRPLYADEDENLRPRKIARGESPLKGAAGRRLDQQRRSQGSSGAVSSQQPPPISRDITFLLSLIPSREAYNHHYFNPQAMVRLIRDTHIPDYSTWKATQAQSIRHDESRAGHARQPSAEYGRSYSRDSPAPAHIYQQRPASPYRGAAGPSAAPYRHSPLRPGSSGSYEPPASFQAPQYDGASGPPPAVGSWQPPPMPPQPQFGASATQPPFPYVGGPPPPPQQQPPPTYGRYPY